VTFQAADFNRGLLFPAHSFDGVIGVAVLQCATDPRQFLQEIHRVLKPEGIFSWWPLTAHSGPQPRRGYAPRL